MRPIVRKKMYKKGKFLVIAGIVTILGGSAILGQDVKAEQEKQQLQRSQRKLIAVRLFRILPS